MKFDGVIKMTLGVILLLPICSCSKEGESESEEERSSVPVSGLSVVRTKVFRDHSPRIVKKMTLPKSKRVLPVTDDDERIDLTPEDRETLMAIEKAMEAEDVRMLAAAVAAAVRSPSTEVRSEMVDALGWFGAKTMDDLIPFLADPDADIAENALNNWTSALGEIEDEKRKCDMVEGIMRILKNEDALESLVMEINDCDTLLLLQTVVNLIQCDNSAASKVACGHYEFMTGEEFTTLEAANAWAEENCSESTEN